MFGQKADEPNTLRAYCCLKSYLFCGLQEFLGGCKDFSSQTAKKSGAAKTSKNMFKLHTRVYSWPQENK
jgi:hypothetical protein